MTTNWKPVKIFGQNFSNTIKFDNRTRNERFTDNSPSHFKCDFQERGLNLGPGQYGIVIDEIVNNMPIAPWQTDIPIVNNFYNPTQPPYGDSVLSFQSLTWGTNIRGLTHDWAMRDGASSGLWRWDNRENRDRINYSQHVASQLQWDIPSSDFKEKHTSVGRQLIYQLLSNKTAKNNLTLPTFNTHTQTAGDFIQYGLFNKGGLTDRNDLGSYTRWPKPNATFKTREERDHILAISCQMFGNYLTQATNWHRGRSTTWKIHYDDTNLQLQFSIPILNTIATDTQEDWPIIANNSFQGLPLNGNMHIDSNDKLRPGLISMNEKECRRFCHITGLTYGIICPHPDDFIQMYKQIGIGPYYRNESNCTYCVSGWETGTGTLYTNNRNRDQNLQRTFPFRFSTPQEEDSYSFKHLWAWYMRDIINLMIASLRTHNDLYYLTLQSLHFLLLKYIPLDLFDSISKKNIFGSIQTFYIPTQQQLQDMECFFKINDLINEMVALLQSLGLLHYFKVSEQEGGLTLQNKDVTTVKPGAFITSQQIDTNTYQTICCGKMNLYFPYHTPDYFGVNREIKLQSNIIAETFRGSFSEPIFDTWIINQAGYTSHVTEKRTHMLPPDPIIFEYKNQNSAQKVVPVTSETIDYISFRFSNERDENYPFKPESTTTVTFHFVMDNDSKPISTGGVSLQK